MEDLDLISKDIEVKVSQYFETASHKIEKTLEDLEKQKSESIPDIDEIL